MDVTKLFVGGLAWHTDDATLREGFEYYGEVLDAVVVKDHDTGRSRGFGFVVFALERDAESAVRGLNNQEFDGRIIRVDRSSKNPDPRNRGFQGRGGYNRPEGTARYIRGVEMFENLGLHDEDTELELNDHLPHTMSASGGGYPEAHKRSPGDANSPGASQLRGDQKMTYRFLCDWELPSLFQARLYSGPELTGLVLGTITLVVIGGQVQLMTCRQYLEKLHSQRGLEIVELILYTFCNHFLDIGEEDVLVKATYSELMIETSSEDLQMEIRDIFVWLCLAFRMPRQGSASMISTGSFEGNEFRMDAHSISCVTSCWPSLFGGVVIVVKPTETFPPGGGLLKLSFGALLQLTAVEYPVMIDSGLVLMGYFTALVPTEVGSSGSIVWHLETSSGNQQLRQSELRATRGSWLKRQTLEELRTTETLLGWCASARVQLGTNSLDAASVRWSDATVKPTTWRWKGANLQLLAQSAAPIQAGAQIGLSWERVVNTTRFTSGGNYTGCLASSMLEHVVLYDVAAQRAWLVPLLSVYHHMLFIYCGIMLPSNSSRKPIPATGPSFNGTSSSFKTLQTSGGIVVEGANEDILTIRDLIMGFAINFSGVSVQAPRGSRIYGYELLDLVLGSPRSELKTTTVKRDGLGWAPLLNELPCLFCAELGDAIVGSRGSEENSPCNYIPAGQDLLTSPLETIRTLCQKQGSTMTSVSGQITQTHVLMFQHGPLSVRCSHDALALSSCWETPKEFVQKLYRGMHKDGDARRCSENLYPEMGAVVLGNVKPQGSFGFRDSPILRDYT